MEMEQIDLWCCISETEVALHVSAHSHRRFKNFLRRWLWIQSLRILLYPILGERDVNRYDNTEDCGQPSRVLENNAYCHTQTEIEAVSCESDILVAFFVC